MRDISVADLDGTDWSAEMLRQVRLRLARARRRLDGIISGLGDSLNDPVREILSNRLD